MGNQGMHAGFPSGLVRSVVIKLKTVRNVVFGRVLTGVHRPLLMIPAYPHAPSRLVCADGPCVGFLLTLRFHELVVSSGVGGI